MTHDIYQTFANGAKNKSPSLTYQYNQTFLLPLMHIRAYKNRIYGLLKHHKTTNSPLQKFSMFKVLKCYTIDYPDKNQLHALINQTQSNILFCSTGDLKHQLDKKLDRLQTGHIHLSFVNTPDNPLKTQKAREIFALADEHPQIKQTHLYQIVQDVLTVASV